MNGTDVILQNTISYLYKISEVLPKDLAVPKSYYASKCRILELKGNSVLPNKLTGDRVRCPRCCLNLTDYPPKVHLKAKRKQDKFTRKVLRKVQNGQSLTLYQEKFKKLLPKMADKNILIRTCLFCRKEIKKNVEFQRKKIRKVVNGDTTCTPQKKKKKKKDKYAGLVPSACILLDEAEEKMEIPVKKNVTQILRENSLKQKEEAKIIYNLMGKVKDKKKKKQKSKNNEEKVIIKSAKMKIDERKQKKADKQKKNKIQNLLNGTDKPKVSNILSGFLQSL